jgi:hypothetical protein
MTAVPLAKVHVVLDCPSSLVDYLTTLPILLRFISYVALSSKIEWTIHYPKIPTKCLARFVMSEVSSELDRNRHLNENEK